MLDKFIEGVPNLLAEILQEQRRTTEAVTKLAEAIATAGKGAQVAAAKADAAKVIEKAADKASETVKTATAYAEQKAITTEPDEPKQEAETAKPQGEAAQATDYETTAKRVTGLAGVKGRDAAVAVLSKFGATKLKDVPAEKFAEVIAACDEALA